MLKLRRSRLMRYAVTLLTVALALLLMLLLNRVIDVTTRPFLLFFAPVIFNAWYGGLEGGVLATGLITVALAYFFLVPTHSLVISWNQALKISLFVLQGVFFSGLIAMLQTSQRRSYADLHQLRTSEEHLSLALKAAQMGTWDWNMTTDKITWSKNHELLFGLEAGAFDGTYEFFMRCIHPEDCPLVAQATKRAIATFTEYNQEFRVVWPDGSIHWIAGKGQFFYDATGKATRMIGVAWDISDRKQKEEEIRNLNTALERRLKEMQTLLEVIPIGIGIAEDPECNQITINPSFAKHLGISPDVNASLSAPEEEKPTSFKVFRDGRELAPEELPMQYATAHGVEVLGCEVDVVHDNGKVVKLLEHVAPLFDEEGKVRGCVGAFVDITERKQAEKKLRESEERYRELIELSPDGIFIQCEQKFVFVNSQCVKLFGAANAEEILGKPILDFVHPDYQEIIKARIRQINEERMPVPPLEEKWLRLDGSVFDAEVTSVPFTYQDKPAAQVIIRDISDRKRYEETLQQQAEALRNQQQWLEYVLNLIPTPLLLIEPGTARVTFANQAANELAGGEFPKDKPAEEYHTIYYCTDANGNRIPDEQMPGVRVARGERLDGFEMEWHTPEGIHSIIVFGDILPPMYGHPAICTVVFQHVTKLKQIEKALQQSNQRLKLLSETASDLLSSHQPLTLIDSLFKKLSAQMGLDVYFNFLVQENKQVMRLASSGGISQEVAKQIEWLELGQAVCGTVAQQRCQMAVTDVQHSTDPKTDLIRSLGVTAYSCQPLMVQGQLFGTLSFGSRSRARFHPDEIALMQALCDQMAIAMERASLITSLQQQTEHLREANRLKDEFLAIVSHELRTPLNSILGWSQMLRSRNMSESMTAKALETIERNAKTQKQLIEDLLEVSRVITGKLRLKAQAIALTPIIEAAIESIRPAADAKEISLINSFDPTVGCVFGDSERLQQVLWNLLSNAIKFTPNGGQVEVELSVVSNQETLLTTDKYAQITVRDTGIGIKPDFLPYVFDRFRQADSSTTRSYGGLGLGLAIVRHLVELHGGTVQVTSPGEGQGTTFTVRLPLLKSAEYRVTSAENGKGNSVSQQSDNSYSTLNTQYSLLAGVRVLVVDDDADTRDYLATVLSSCSAEVQAAASAREALEIIEHSKPDVLVCDIGMPELDGYALIRMVRSLSPEQGGQIPAAALTAYARTEDRTRSLQEGFQIHLPKPVEPNELVVVVANLVERIANC